MTRVKRGYVARRRRDRIQRVTMGCKRALSRLTRSVQQQAIKTLVYSHRDRSRRKRAFRSVWIARLNAAARARGLSYSQLIDRLYESNVLVNRKMLAQVARLDPQAWHTILSSITMAPHTDHCALEAGNDPVSCLDESCETAHLAQSHPGPNEPAAHQDWADPNSAKPYDADGATHGWRHRAHWRGACEQIACHYKQQIDYGWLHHYLNQSLNQAGTGLA